MREETKEKGIMRGGGETARIEKGKEILEREREEGNIEKGRGREIR